MILHSVEEWWPIKVSPWVSTGPYSHETGMATSLASQQPHRLLLKIGARLTLPSHSRRVTYRHGHSTSSLPTSTRQPIHPRTASTSMRHITSCPYSWPCSSSRLGSTLLRWTGSARCMTTRHRLGNATHGMVLNCATSGMDLNWRNRYPLCINAVTTGYWTRLTHTK